MRLASEKTIEAGLVISQMLAEGKQRVLLIVPKSLMGQWQTELYTLFGIEAREGRLVSTHSQGPACSSCIANWPVVRKGLPS